jgi:D-galacturonate reductase
MVTLPRCGFIGAGMIMKDQNFGAVLQLVRNGVVSRDLLIASTRSESIHSLISDQRWRVRFPQFNLPKMFQTFAGEKDKPDPLSYVRMLSAMNPGDIVFICTPDNTHYDMIMECLLRDLHVIVVKSLCTTHAQAREIEEVAYQRGLFVGVEFHKMADYRAIQARERFQKGDFGTPTAATATMIEDDSYLGSNFDNHFTPENDNPTGYVGCHYGHQVAWLTGQKPKWISVRGVKGRFKSGVECYSWSSSMWGFDTFNLVMHNGLQFPANHLSRNHQGLEIFGSGKDNEGTYLQHLDHQRGMCYVHAKDAVGVRSVDAGTDYVGWIPRGDQQSGYDMIGYGFRSIDNLFKIACKVRVAPSLTDKQELLRIVDKEEQVATPKNVGWLALLREGIMLSIANDGFPYHIHYPTGVVSPQVRPR